ncbi:hypothetical protein TDB9533_01627 [Thalassocella blandensis]|nr:hypothetical protein TDB9533_01627 [Thalassocella blandensis]
MNLVSTLRPYTWLLILCCGLNACSTVTTPPQKPARVLLDASDYYEQGVDAYKTWSENEDINQLQLSRQYLEKAYQLNPHALATQVELYRTKYILTALANDTQNIKALEDFYSTMNPIARSAMAPPAILEYHIRKGLNATPESLIQDLHKALEQSHYNAQTWTNIADHYFDYQQYSLATAAAKVAYDFSPDNAYFAHEVGRTLSAQAKESNCVYEEKELLKRSVHYINQASVLEKDNWQYLSNASLQYLNLGLAPLAWNQAQKAVDISQNMLTVIRYLEIAVILGKYQEAYTMLNSFLNGEENDLSDFKYERVFTLLAILSFNDGDKALSDRFVFQANKFASDHFYQLHSRWLYKSDENTFQSSLEKAQNLNEADKLQVEYLKQDSSMTIEDLLAHANNVCQTSEFYFTAADKAFINGELDLARHYLEKVKEQKALRDLSYLWASALLDKGLSTEMKHNEALDP